MGGNVLIIREGPLAESARVMALVAVHREDFSPGERVFETLRGRAGARDAPASRALRKVDRRVLTADGQKRDKSDG
jgi:hypothetical protein